MSFGEFCRYGTGKLLEDISLKKDLQQIEKLNKNSYAKLKLQMQISVDGFVSRDQTMNSIG